MPPLQVGLDRSALRLAEKARVAHSLSRRLADRRTQARAGPCPGRCFTLPERRIDPFVDSMPLALGPLVRRPAGCRRRPRREFVAVPWRRSVTAATLVRVSPPWRCGHREHKARNALGSDQTSHSEYHSREKVVLSVGRGYFSRIDLAVDRNCGWAYGFGGNNAQRFELAAIFGSPFSNV